MQNGFGWLSKATKSIKISYTLGNHLLEGSIQNLDQRHSILLMMIHNLIQEEVLITRLLSKETEELCLVTISSRSRLNYARAGLKLDPAHMARLALSLMVSMNFRKRNMFHLGTRPNYVNNFMKINIVRMVFAVSSFTRRSSVSSSK